MIDGGKGQLGDFIHVGLPRFLLVLIGPGRSLQSLLDDLPFRVAGGDTIRTKLPPGPGKPLLGEGRERARHIHLIQELSILNRCLGLHSIGQRIDESVQ